jgi:hypothetical protein
VPDQEALRRAYEFPSDAAVRKLMTELIEQTRRLIGPVGPAASRRPVPDGSRGHGRRVNRRARQAEPVAGMRVWKCHDEQCTRSSRSSATNANGDKPRAWQ